jgi:hypothetical protein
MTARPVLIRNWILILSIVLVLTRAGFPQSTDLLTAPKSPVIVIGFVGGFAKSHDLIHSEVQLASRLRETYSAVVDVETFGCHQMKKARARVLRELDSNQDGTLSSYEKQNARVIIYGHSWGASEAISLARQLEKDGIPVLLTVQVDSISQMFQNDSVIPANVAQAANFYQTHGLLHGQSRIRAADPMRTKIIGNFRFDYEGQAYKCHADPWYDRIFVRAHSQIECDPGVWKQAESLMELDLNRRQKIIDEVATTGR